MLYRNEGPPFGEAAARLIEVVAPPVGYVMALEAYFDESGTHDGSVFTSVSAYLFRTSDARALEAEWAEVIASYEGRLTHFHMVDCAHGMEEFAALSMAERIDCQSRLIQLIRRRMARGFSVSFSRHWYRELMPHHPLIGDEYQFGITRIMDLIGRWRNVVSDESDVAYFFETGHASAPRVNAFINEQASDQAERFPPGYYSHTFLKKRSSALLQAADLLAWQYGKFAKNQSVGRPPRKDFMALIEGQEHKYRYAHYNSGGILDLVDSLLTHDAWGDWQQTSDLYGR